MSKMSRTPLYFNPRSPHGERRHGPLARARRVEHFNPRSPHGERPSALFGYEIEAKFQSTLPARGATSLMYGLQRAIGYFNPRSPHGERPQPGRMEEPMNYKFQSTLPARGATRRQRKRDVHGDAISIHAPRTGSDGCCSARKAEPRQFQSTLPARGATLCPPR